MKGAVCRVRDAFLPKLSPRRSFEIFRYLPPIDFNGRLAPSCLLRICAFVSLHCCGEGGAVLDRDTGALKVLNGCAGSAGH